MYTCLLIHSRTLIRAGRADTLHEHGLAGYRRGAGESGGHDRGFDAADPAVYAAQSRTREAAAHRVFHLYCFKLRREFDADRRSAAVSGVFEGCAVQLDADAFVERLAAGVRRAAGSILLCRPQDRPRARTTSATS